MEGAIWFQPFPIWMGRYCLFTKIEKHVSLMSANVKHSQRMNELPLRPWFAASNDGRIISAHCNCMAGYV